MTVRHSSATPRAGPSSAGPGDGNPRWCVASAVKVPNRTSRREALEPESATIARCRCNRARSSTRRWSPPTHLTTPCLVTPCRRATASSGIPSWTSATAPSTLVTLLTLPGRASHGSTRSRALQSRHRASRTWMCSYLVSVCRPRSTWLRVNSSARLPQRAQTPSIAIGKESVASASAYLVESMRSTCTTRTSDGSGGRGRRKHTAPPEPSPFYPISIELGNPPDQAGWDEILSKRELRHPATWGPASEKGIFLEVRASCVNAPIGCSETDRVHTPCVRIRVCNAPEADSALRAELDLASVARRSSVRREQCSGQDDETGNGKSGGSCLSLSLSLIFTPRPLGDVPD